MDDNVNRFLYDGNAASSSALEKLSMIAMEASEQSERLYVPKIAMNLAQVVIQQEDKKKKDGFPTIWSISKLLEFWIDQPLDGRVLLICRERKKSNSKVSPLLRALDELHQRGIVKTAFLIGPEGGWSIQEETLLDQFSSEYPHKIMCISLGSSILRAETAAILATGSYALWRESIP
jgi:RsmE family RNA methyltransferase